MQLFASLREGSDGHNQAGAAVKLISIHAPVKGATSNSDLRIDHAAISIHASVKGATARYGYGNAHRPFSIHAPAKEAT